MTDKYDVFAFFAQLSAPLAPASTLALTLADSIKAQGANDTVALWLAGGSGLGAELLGATAAYVAMEAFRKKRYGIFAVSISALAVYTVFMIYGLSLAKNSIAVQSSVMISVSAHLAASGLQALRGQAAEEKTASTNKIALENIELEKERIAGENKLAALEEEKIKLEKEKIALAALRVQAKMAASTASTASTGGDEHVHLSGGQNGQTDGQNGQNGQPDGQPALRPEWLEWMRTYIQAKQAAKEKVTLRGMVAADGCPFTSPTTAKTYLAALNRMETK